ncbi:hypothetical protein AAFF39_00615 [Lactococcus garvieae]
MSQNEINIPVKVENIDKLKNLSEKLKRQVDDIEETAQEIRLLKLELKINQ